MTTPAALRTVTEPPFVADAPRREADTRVRDVVSVWWPLAASWLMMAFELPIVSAVLARLPDPEIHLAAFGGIVFPLAMFIEAPIIMLLAASTALSRDRATHRKLSRFVAVVGAGLTALHVLIAATPLFDVVVAGWMGTPVELRGPARLGLLLMTPWTWSIAYRRFQQGVLIRAGRSRIVGIGTLVRLGANASALALCWFIGGLPGIAVGAVAVATGVMAEALFAGLAVRPVVAALPPVDEDSPPLTRGRFFRFYWPLATTSVLMLGTQPIASAAMSRMPSPIASLAAWPVVNGLTFMLRSAGFAFHEVVVALLARPGAERALRRFAILLACITSGLLALIAATPLAELWFAGVSGLSRELTELAKGALWIAIPLAAFAVAQASLSGRLVHRHATRGVSEAVTLQLVVTTIVLVAGVAWGGAPGLHLAIASFLAGHVVQIAWLARRGRAVAVIAALIGGVAISAPARATTVPTGFVHEMLVGEPFIQSPVGFDFLPDGRFVLVELESGVVRIAAVGDASSDSIARIPDVRADHPERGLLGVAVDPDWPTRPYLYFHYTALDSTVHVAMWEAAGALSNPSSTAITLANPFLVLGNIDDNAGIHNAGTLRFAPDGTLLVSVGEDAQPCMAQDLTSPLGKLLRLDISGMPQGGPGPPPIADVVPAGNPFAGAGWTPLVYAWGLRNPFRFDVDAPSGDVFIGNVGSHLFEEIELVPLATPGLNFAWPQFENTTPLGCCGTCGKGNTFTFPIHPIPHPLEVISVIGGPLVHDVPSSPTSLPSSYDGDYIYAEIFSGKISRLRRTGSSWDFAPPAAGQPDSTTWGSGFVGLSDFRQGPDGALYLVSLGLSFVDLPRGLHRIRVNPSFVAAPEIAASSPARLVVEPNPSRAGDHVAFRVPERLGEVRAVRIFDAAGRLVRSLGEAEIRRPSHEWDGLDRAGRPVAAGVYLVRVDGVNGRASGTVTRVR